MSLEAPLSAPSCVEKKKEKKKKRKEKKRRKEKERNESFDGTAGRMKKPVEGE